MKEKKGIVRSVRMTQTVHDYVQRMDGKSFNDKFNKMVIFCMTREKIAYDQVRELEKKQEELKGQILKEENFLKNIDDIKQLCKTMLEDLRGY